MNKHELDSSDASGNGHHGHCKHCKLPFVTDLGYNSWKDTTCIDRKVSSFYEFDKEFKSYCNFKGLIFNVETQCFSRSYDEKIYKIDDIKNIISKLKKNHDYTRC